MAPSPLSTEIGRPHYENEAVAGFTRSVFLWLGKS